jgi:PAS domain S-box-containing protein
MAWGGDRLAIRQVAYALAIALAFGVVLEVASLARDVVQERHRIRAAGESVLALVRAPAARAADTLDPVLGDTVVTSTLEVPFVVRAELTDTLGRPIAAVSRERPALALRWLTDRLFGAHLSFRVSFDRNGSMLPEGEVAGRSVGTLVVEFDTRVLGQDFLARSWFLLLTGLASTLILGLALAVVAHLMITRPLARIVAAVEYVDPEAPAQLPVALGRSHARDEFGRLGNALNALLARFGQTLLQRREAFERLAASEARYRAVVDTQTEFIARITPDGRLSFVSDSYCRYYGRSREELFGRRFNEFTLTVPEDRERDAAHLRSLTPEYPSEMIELRRQLPDGRICWVQWNDTAIFDAQERLLEIQSVGRDVTERVAAEARFLAAAETLPDGLAIFDPEDRLVYHNRRYPEHQMANVRAVLALGKRYQDLLRDALALGPIHHPDMGADFPQRRVEMRKQPYSEHEQHLADGRWVRVREGRMADGGLVLVTSDITGRRALEAELRQAEKLKAVGTLASGIAHDFNNILATIFTSTEVALLHLAEDTPASAALGRVMSAGRRGRQLCAEILAFSRSERTPRVAIDLGATVASALDFCRHTLGPRIELRATLPGEPVFVAADESQIHQIVSNLCLNAAQAMPDGGRISVRLESGWGHNGQGWAKLRVADTGCGMDTETAARAFDPFFTTKPVGEGTGLGLAVVHGTVQALGGRIRLRTAPGQGAAFAITLPRISRVGPAHLPPVEGVPPGQGRAALLVEPDAEAAEAVAIMLRAADYRVTRHANPSVALEALAVSRQAAVLVAALSSDTMPDGIGLATAMRRLVPPLSVVLLASATSTPAEIAAAEALPVAVVAKPVLRQELAAALVAQAELSRGMPPQRAVS